MADAIPAPADVKPLIHVSEAGQEYLVQIPPENRGRATGIPGWKWDGKRRVYRYPKTQRLYEALRREFERDAVLEIQPIQSEGQVPILEADSGERDTGARREEGNPTFRAENEQLGGQGVAETAEVEKSQLAQEWPVPGSRHRLEENEPRGLRVEQLELAAGLLTERLSGRDDRIGRLEKENRQLIAEIKRLRTLSSAEAQRQVTRRSAVARLHGGPRDDAGPNARSRRETEEGTKPLLEQKQRLELKVKQQAGRLAELANRLADQNLTVKRQAERLDDLERLSKHPSAHGLPVEREAAFGTCRRCNGDGGAGGRCPRCGGNGFEPGQ